MLFPIKKEGAGNIQKTILSDRYLILSELGRGSGSIVYLVRHQKLGEYRAIKCISKHSDYVWQIREAVILNHLKHPQIPIVYDMEEDEEFYYIIEEYLEGESLEAIMLQSSFITLSFIYHTMMQVANVLSYLHQIKPNPMVYQDLKAEHVIITKEGIKLIDFGIAAYLGDEGNKFQNYGTPEFSAPEKRSDAKISIQTDVYSIGKLLEELILAEASGESQCLMHIVKKATHPDVRERYVSMEAFQAALTEIMQSQKNSMNHQKHLLKNIVAVGSQPHIGTTHIAISLTDYMNRQNIAAVYQEKNFNQDMRVTIRNGGFTEEGGLYRRRNFLGMPQYRDGVCINVPKDTIKIMDYGTRLEEALNKEKEADLFLLIVGSREWEKAHADRAYELVRDNQRLVIIANFGDLSQAKQYAKKFGRTVYSFPLDANPFFMTKEKERLFERLLKKQGGESGEGKESCHWYSGKCQGKWRHPFIRGIGKLCVKWIRRKDSLR